MTMPITFSINSDYNYLICAYTGEITDEELYDSWKEFFEGKMWKPGLMELADNRKADFSAISADGVRRLSDLCRTVYEKHNIDSVKTALCGSKPLTYGFSRMYQTFSSESPEKARVFKDFEAAEAWLKDKTKE
jgi:hypothetical protein